MEFLLLSHRRFSARNVPSGEERGETDVFADYLSQRLLVRNNDSYCYSVDRIIENLLFKLCEKY